MSPSPTVASRLSPVAIPAAHSVIPASHPVIPAKAGIQKAPNEA